MRWRQVIFLWLIAALLGAQYLFVDRRRPVVHPSERPVRPRLLAALAVDAVVGVRLERDGASVALRRHGEVWAVEQPAGGRIESGLVQALIESLTALEEIDRLAGGGRSDEALGLGDGALQIHVLDGGGHEVHLTLGGRNAAGTAVYARLGDSSDAVLVGRNLEYYASLILQEARRTTEPQGDGPVA